MIAIDSSAIIAIMEREPETEAFVTCIALAEARCMSAASYLECAMLIVSRTGSRESLDRWLAQLEIDIVPFDAAQARLAADAFARFGRGRHAARLNYGDCFAYALARTRDAPLLYKGTDFHRTDLRSACADPS